ncbi:hypothetical protein B0H15DRAFT_280680 [Mycena belliarum]|uniref:Uncharacterized protein n=1 Tax=Mycena belliarum TaxID=1033014 RepID=A0AAD6U446_9AGAR|nr:hypothetical protein B0H15DRAFT_280680 [Mycena belliae]
MTPKHRSRSSSPPSEPPHKRRHTIAAHGIHSSPFSFSYPYISSTPSTPFPATPSDSPSNPFGRTRTWNLLQALPPPTSFSKHLPLRFQYLKRGIPRETLDGIYRVVQVPQSYTLVHLKSLIGFLFGGAYGQLPPDPDDEGQAHMFELKKDMAVYSSAFRPGQIKHGNTWAYASSVLDPYLYYPDWENDDPEVEAEAEAKAEACADASPAEEIGSEDGRKWTAEEDLTVAHAWPEGGDTTRGIVYQHSATLQIHITVNTLPLKTRRGKGNLPHVFVANGLVFLDEPAEEDRLEPEDPTAQLDPSNWNDPEDKFAEYYGENTILPYAGYSKEADSSSAPLPALTFSSSPTRASSSSLASSPLSVAGAFLHTTSSPGRFPKYTPAPRPAQRKRLRHLQYRIGTLTRVHGYGTGFPPYHPNKKRVRVPFEDHERRACSEEL